MHLDVGDRVECQVRFQPGTIGRVGFDGIHAPGGSDAACRVKGEVTQIRPAVDEMTAGRQQLSDPPAGFQLVNPRRHRHVGIGRQIQIERDAGQALDAAFSIGRGEKTDGPTVRCGTRRGAEGRCGCRRGRWSSGCSCVLSVYQISRQCTPSPKRQRGDFRF